MDYARQLLDAAQQSGLVSLPSLTLDELFVLGASGQAIVDDAILNAWKGLPEERRYQIADETIEGLVDRRLLDPVLTEPGALAASSGSDASDSEVGQRMLMHPALAIIQLARTLPTWIGLCSIQDVQHTDLRMYGLGDMEDAYRGVVVETLERPSEEEPSPDAPAGVAAASYRYGLASTSAAATLLADWAVSAQPESGPTSESAQVTRFIDLFVHLEGEPLIRRRFEICPDQQGGAYVLTGPQQPQQRESHDRESLAEYLHRAVRALRSGPYRQQFASESSVPSVSWRRSESR